MAISVTDLGTTGNATGTTLALTVPVGGVPSGAAIVVCVSENSQTIGGSVTDTAGNTYIATTGVFLNGTVQNGFGRMFYCYNASALVSGNTITYTKVGSVQVALAVLYATGLQTAVDPLDAVVTTTNTGSSTNPNVASGTPSQAGELFVAFAAFRSSATFSQDSGNGWAFPPSSANSGGTSSSQLTVVGGNQVNAGTAALTFSPTISTGRNWATFVFGFKPGGGSQNKSLSITQGQSIGFRHPPTKMIAMQMASVISMRRAITRSISVFSSSAIAMRRGSARAISVMQSQAVALMKSPGKMLAMASAQMVGLVPRLAYRVTPAIVSGQAIALRRRAAKLLGVTSGQFVAMRRGMTWVTSMASGQNVLLRNGTMKPIAITQAQTVTIGRAVVKLLAVAQAQMVALVKRIAMSITSISSQLVDLFPRRAKQVSVAMSMGQSVMLTTMSIVFAAPKQVLKNIIRRIFMIGS